MEVRGFEMLEHYMQNRSHDNVQVLMDDIRHFPIQMVPPGTSSMTCPWTPEVPGDSQRATDLEQAG